MFMGRGRSSGETTHSYRRALEEEKRRGGENEADGGRERNCLTFLREGGPYLHSAGESLWKGGWDREGKEGTNRSVAMLKKKSPYSLALKKSAGPY